MNIKVVYYSSSGNTKKIADAIAEALQVTAEPMSNKPQISGIDVLFVGGSLRMYMLERHCRKFFRSLKKADMAKNIVLFSTTVSGKGILDYANKLVKAKDAVIYKEEFKCLGNYHKDAVRTHPNDEDCRLAKEFAVKAVRDITAS